MKRAFLISRYAGDSETNILTARRACRAMCRAGFAPFAPHLFYTQFLEDDEPIQRRVGMESGHAWMAPAQFVVLYRPDGVISHGMRIDLAVAKAMGKEILELVSLDPPQFVPFEGSAVTVGLRSSPQLRLASAVD